MELETGIVIAIVVAVAAFILFKKKKASSSTGEFHGEKGTVEKQEEK